MSLESLPNGLRQAIENDHQPVRPLHPAWMRTIFAAAILAVVLAVRARSRPVFDRISINSPCG